MRDAGVMDDKALLDVFKNAGMKLKGNGADQIDILGFESFLDELAASTEELDDE
jgi:hypothetical protein